MKYRATSYSEGRVIESVTFEAHTHSAALLHPALRGLPYGSISQTGQKARVIGVKVVR